MMNILARARARDDLPSDIRAPRGQKRDLLLSMDIAVGVVTSHAHERHLILSVAISLAQKRITLHLGAHREQLDFLRRLAQHERQIPKERPMGEVHEIVIHEILHEHELGAVGVHHGFFGARGHHHRGQQEQQLVAEGGRINYVTVLGHRGVIGARLLEGKVHLSVAITRLLYGVSVHVLGVVAGLPLLIAENPNGLLEQQSMNPVAQTQPNVLETQSGRPLLRAQDLQPTAQLGRDGHAPRGAIGAQLFADVLHHDVSETMVVALH